MDSLLFRCFITLFERVNLIKGNYLEEDEELRLVSYEELVGMNIFWGILRRCDNKGII